MIWYSEYDCSFETDTRDDCFRSLFIPELDSKVILSPLGGGKRPIFTIKSKQIEYLYSQGNKLKCDESDKISKV